MKTSQVLAISVGLLLSGYTSLAQGNMSNRTSDTAFVRKNIADNITEIQMSEQGRDKGTASVKKMARQMISDHSVMLADLRKVASKMGLKDVFADPGTGNNVAPPATPDTTTEANGTGISGSKPPTSATGSATTSTTTASSATTGTMSTGNSDGANGSSGSSNAGSGVGTSTAMGTTGSGMNMPGMQNLSDKEFSKKWSDDMLRMHQAKLRELTAASKQITNPELLAVVNKAIPKVRMHVEMLLKAYQADR